MVDTAPRGPGLGSPLHHVATVQNLVNQVPALGLKLLEPLKNSGKTLLFLHNLDPEIL